MHEVVERVPPELVGPDEQNVATDPQHGGGTDDRERREQLGHAVDQRSADLLRRF